VDVRFNVLAQQGDVAGMIVKIFDENRRDAAQPRSARLAASNDEPLVALQY